MLACTTKPNVSPFILKQLDMHERDPSADIVLDYQVMCHKKCDDANCSTMHCAVIRKAVYYMFKQSMGKDYKIDM